MSAQAVLSMIASGHPAAPQGLSGSEGASGFRDLLAALRSSQADEGVEFPTPPPIRPGGYGGKLADDGSEPLVLPGAVDVKAPEPQILPGTVAAKDEEPLVLPGPVDAKPPEPQILPGMVAAKDEEPLVLPGAVDAKPPEPQVLPGPVAEEADPLVPPGTLDRKEPEPQVLPGMGPGKTAEPLVLPGDMVAKGLTPQVLPVAVEDKAARPQVLPGSDSLEVAPPAPNDGATPDVTGVADRPRASQPQAHSLQAGPPPLRALAERTSKPLDEAGIAPSPSRADTKTTAPPTSPVSAPVEQPAKPAPQALQAAAAPQADGPDPAPDEGPSNGVATTGASEAAAPARDHSLSTLSRASIDATAQIAAQIQRRLEGRSTRFEIALRPAELGRVDVKLDIDAEGRLAARLAFDNPAAATDLRGRVDELRRQLEAAGFQLADDAFEFAERDSGSSTFDRGQDARHGQNRAFAAAARLKTEIDVAQPPEWLSLSLSPSGVDMKV